MKKMILGLLVISFTYSGLFAQKKDSPTEDRIKELVSADFQVNVDHHNVRVYTARVSAMPVNVWPGVKRPLEQTEISSFCSFDINREVKIEIISFIDIKSVVIRPLSLHIKPVIKGNHISFVLKAPRQIVVEVNSWHKALALFANPPDNDHKKTGADDLYFGPGEHFPGIIHAKSNQTIDIAEGAVVHTAIIANKVQNLKIQGRGIIDGSLFKRNIDTINLIELIQCKHVSIDGVVLRDAQIWTVMTHESEQIKINNVKIIGMWRYNTDGIDLVNSKNVLIQNCFVRAFDDCIVIKGINMNLVPEKQLWNISNIRVRNCVVWNDWGRALEIGAETIADSIKNIVYEDIDIIHFVHIAIDIQNGNHADISDVYYNNIRVEEPITENAYLDDLNDPVLDTNEVKNNPRNTKKFSNDELGRLIVIEVKENGWVKDSSLGHVSHISYENIHYSGNYHPKSFFQGFSGEHSIQNIRFENIYLNSTKVTDNLNGNFHANEFVRNLIFQ